MSRAFVLGNGISRQGIDLDLLQSLGPVYGCNAIYREFTPTVLISTDVPISEAIQRTGYAQKNRMYTRRPLPDLGAKRIDQEYFGYSSGPVAVSIAAADANRAVYMIGFDMGATRTGRFNNCYADTEFYKKSSAVPTYTGNWVKQIVKICKDFRKVSFYRVVGATTADIADFKSVGNLHHMPMADFLNRINNTKEL